MSRYISLNIEKKTFLSYYFLMDIVEYLKLCLVRRNLTFSRLAELTGQSQSNLSNKVRRGKFQTDELEKIAAALDAELEIRFVDRESGKPII